MPMKNSVRIIAGKWRRQRIHFPQDTSIRPTQDRIRETLFNWLMHDISQAKCLDLFAGSGALGFEALSRGAAHVTFVDNDRQVIESLKNNAQHFAATNVDIHRAVIPCPDLALSCSHYKIVFLDPPFGQTLFLPAIEWLQRVKVITPDTLIYYEIEKQACALIETLDANIIHEKSTKKIHYGLFTLAA